MRLDRVYPAENRRLATEILQSGGALISEFPIGSPALKHHFPMRNRIIAGLSKGLIITQAHRNSGALITARYALDQGRDVFAVPTSPLHTQNSGTNHLIRCGEATLIESATDVLTEWKMDTVAKSAGPIEYTSLEATLVKALSKEPRTVDELVIDAGLNVARVSEALITLQLKQTVRQINLKWTLI
ncbi:DNA-protecting protein DprA [Candidatus Peregrinibacteria bacterium]|nr:MAG: DNA-protecting protein DprA [Candidatus Peregrinibacteria bacterium]